MNDQVLTSKTHSMWLNVLTILVFVLSCATTFGFGFSRLFFPFDEGRFEGGLWAPSHMLASGINPYALNHTVHAPFTMSPYGPLPYALFGVGLRLFGWQFQSGRALMLLCLALCAWCVFFVVRHATSSTRLASTRLAILGAALFLCQRPVSFWAGVQRPDFLALALGLSAFVVALKAFENVDASLHQDTERSRFGMMIVCAVLCVGALLSRVTTISPVLLVATLCYRIGTRRELTVFLFAAFALFTSVTVALNASSDGGYLWQQWILPSGAPKSIDFTLWQVINLFIQSPASVVCVLLGLWAQSRGLWRIVKPKKGVNEYSTNALLQTQSVVAADAKQSQRLVFIGSLCWWATISSIAVAIITSSHVGSDLNYWLEPAAFGAIAAMVAWDRIAFTIRKTRFATAVFYVVSALAITFSATLPNRERWALEQMRWNSLPYLRRVVGAVREYSKPHEPCLSIYPELVLAAGRTPYFNDLMQYDARSPRHQALYKDAVKKRIFPVLVGQIEWVTPGYHKLKLPSELSGQYIYVFVRLDRWKSSTKKPSTQVE